jgi:hypothetical protein
MPAVILKPGREKSLLRRQLWNILIRLCIFGLKVSWAE